MQQASHWRDDAKEIIKRTASKKTMVDILHHTQLIDLVPTLVPHHTKTRWVRYKIELS